MYLTDGKNLKSIHANFWVEKLQFTVARVNNNLYSINCKIAIHVHIAKSNTFTWHMCNENTKGSYQSTRFVHIISAAISASGNSKLSVYQCMAQYSLFVLKVALNPNQATIYQHSCKIPVCYYVSGHRGHRHYLGVSPAQLGRPNPLSCKWIGRQFE